ncbi:MAG: FAD-dependent oxidoreductase [Candidatus Peregrinibacteria bacterium]|nr:FAD-dependent oxidoreductase [Candidatus Peregrinibacteria bacterium]
MVKTRKRILILGAGFAGLRTAIDLSSKINLRAYEIILIDKSDIHLYTPDLYEIASAFNENITEECLTQLKETVATRITSIIDKDKVAFIQDTVTDIDPKKRSVKFKKGKRMSYDILVVALGSVPNYFGIPGLEEHGHPLKTINNALEIHCLLDRFLPQIKRPRNVTITVGGGGPTGVELVAELVGYLNLLCNKYNYPREKVRIELIEAGDHLAGMGDKGTAAIIKRFEEKGIVTRLKNRIIEVEARKVHIQDVNGKVKKVMCDMVIWTGGVQVNPLIQKTIGDPELRGAIEVNEYLQSKQDKRIFAAGDNAYTKNPKTGKPAGMLAQVAFVQGILLASNIAAKIARTPMKKFKIHPNIYVIPIGGRFGLCKVFNWVFTGTWPWYLRRLISLKYASSLLPFWQAIRKWQHGTKIFIEND